MNLTKVQLSENARREVPVHTSGVLDSRCTHHQNIHQPNPCRPRTTASRIKNVVSHSLSRSVTSINDEISSSGVGAGITSKVKINTLQLPWIGVSSQRSQPRQASFISNGQSPEIAVSIYPGDTELTLPPHFAHSTANDFQRWICNTKSVKIPVRRER